VELLDNLALGLTVVFTPTNLLFCFVGALVGTLIGVLPGLGPATTIAMLLPITYLLPPETAIIMLSGIYYGAQYGGSTTSILVKLPGEASSVITVLDGYAMTEKGRGGAALAVAAVGSLFAGTVATLLIALFSPTLAQVALQFGSPEYFSLIVFGLVASVVLSQGNVLKSLAMVVLGLFLATVGSDLTTGVRRYTFGIPELADGIDFVPLVIGLFGIADVIANLEAKEGRPTIPTIGGLWPSRDEARRSVWPILRGTGIGSVLGLLPGGGAMLSSFAAYFVEMKVSKNASELGKGAIEGVAAPEAANNAGAQTSFIPMLTLGIPANSVMAIMIGALLIQGITPGPRIMTEQAPLFWGLVVSMWIGNLMLVVINLPLIGIWVRLLTIRYRLLFPAILLTCAIGAYSINNSTFDILLAALFSAAGYLLLKLDCRPTPLILGFILGPFLEENLRRSLIVSYGSPGIFVERPLSVAFLLLALAMLAIPLIPRFRRQREALADG
jgi:TctA family transporter